jgi:hypothetical protein
MILPLQQEKTMWQIHAQFRMGDIRVSEIDLTPTICLCFIVATFALMIMTGL